MRAVVLGGGIAGLTAGISLARQGAETTVIEAAPFPGGLASGFRAGGYTFDLFSHRIWTRDEEVVRLLEEWSGGTLLSRRKVSRILLDGSLYNYPLDIRDLLSYRSAGMALRAAAGLASARLSPRGSGGEDFESYLTSRYGESIYGTFFGPYTEKLCGCSPSQISMDLAREAVPETGLIAQLVNRLVGKTAPWDDFLYPANGFMTIPEGMASSLRKAGGALLLGHRVARILRRGGRITSVETVSAGGNLSLETDLVVSTIPHGPFLRAMTPAPSRLAIDAVAALGTRAMIGVYLAIDRRGLSPDHWIYTPDGALRFNRISETTNYSETMAPAGRTGICAEIACDVGDTVWRENDADQSSRVVSDLVRIGLLRSSAEVLQTWVRRFERAYPVYRIGYRENLDRIETELSSVANLIMCGRQGAFWYGSTAQGIRQALDLVRDGAALMRRAA